MENEPKPGPSTNPGAESQDAEGAVGGAGAEVSHLGILRELLRHCFWLPYDTITSHLMR